MSFQNIREGSRTYGILCEPAKPGRYPAILHLPGAGVRPYTGDSWTAAMGVIVLDIGIHGISVTQPKELYDQLAAGALKGYPSIGLDDRDQAYYKRVVVGCVRAVDYIEEFTQWDGQHLAVSGASQGGFLTLVTAALDSRVTCFATVHAALCDNTAALRGVACGWPHYFYHVDQPSKARVETAPYYDGANFARRIKCPGWFSFGYNDEVVPPTTAYATYNVVEAPKTLSTYPQTGHYWHQEQWDEWQAWLFKKLNI